MTRTVLDRVYLHSGEAAHLLPEGDNAGDELASLCGLFPWRGWLGTGTQHEYERAADLPTCLNCERARRRK